MAWDKKYYKAAKDHTAYNLRHVPIQLTWQENKPDIITWIKSFFPLISSCVSCEDFEGAKATTDAIRDFLNEYLPEGEKLPEDVQFKLPEFKAIEIKGIICFVGPNDDYLHGTAEFV